MILSEAPTFDRRLWVYKDELASLGRLYSFEAAVSKGRKHGLCVVGGVQDLVQLDMQLGELPAKAVAVVLPQPACDGWRQCPDDQTHVRDDWYARGGAPPDRRAGTVAYQYARAPARVGACRQSSQISNLPDLNGYLKYGKDWPLAKISFGVRDYPVRVPAYIEAPPREALPSTAVPAPIHPTPPQGEPGATTMIIGAALPSTLS